MCSHGSQVYRDGQWLCRFCGQEIIVKRKKWEPPQFSTDVKLSEYERMKLSWYRDERKWQDNIRSRKIVYENGKAHTVLTDGHGNITGEMPKITLPPPPIKPRQPKAKKEAIRL